jgi:predicted ATPase
MHLGEWQEARIHLEQVIASYDPAQHRDLALLYGCDLGAYAHSYRAWDLWILGYPDQAFNRIQEAVAFARELNHPFSLGFVLVNGVEVHACGRNPQTCQRYAEEAMRLSKEGGFFLLQAWATVLLGWARAQQGEVEEGIAQMRQGLDDWRSMGMEVAAPLFLAWMAEAYGKAGRTEEGLALAEEALGLVEKTGERGWEAEAYWVKGDLLQSSGKVEEAEASFHQVIEVARRQEAKSWELRATLSLSRLLQKEGRSQEARQLLSEIYGWFTEGFDTPDLKEARALLDVL